MRQRGQPSRHSAAGGVVTVERGYRLVDPVKFGPDPHGQPGASTGTLSDELRRNVVPPAGQPQPPQQRNSTGASFAGRVTIVPDELTNSLLVRASQADFHVLQEAVKQLDIRPLEVLIEVLIVEARHDRTFSLGTSLFVPPQRLDGGTAEGQINGGGLGDLVIKLMGLGKAQIDATLNAAQENGDVKIMSRPVLLASNNTEASFLVGTQRPFVQVSRSLPTDTPTRDQVVQYNRRLDRPAGGQDIVRRSAAIGDSHSRRTVRRDAQAEHGDRALSVPDTSDHSDR